MNKLKTSFQFGVLPKMPMKDHDLSIQSKAIFAYLCAYAGNDGQAFPSTSLMQYELNVSKNTLFKYLKELKDSGYVTVKKHRTEYNKFQNNVYVLNDEPCIKSCDTASCDTEICDTTINNVTKNKDTKNKYIHLSEKDGAFISLYLSCFYSKFKKNHMRIKEDDYYRVIDGLSEIEEFIDEKDYTDIITEHFDTISKNNNGNILAFIKAKDRFIL